MDREKKEKLQGSEREGEILEWRRRRPTEAEGDGDAKRTLNTERRKKRKPRRPQKKRRIQRRARAKKTSRHNS